MEILSQMGGPSDKKLHAVLIAEVAQTVCFMDFQTLIPG